MLLLPGAFAWAEAGGSADLRYCLDLKSNDEIAKCAGEISPGSKSKTYSRKEVERILEKETTTLPVRPAESGVPAAAVDNSGKDLLPEKPESINK
jgi:hypothetical protein